MVIFFIPVMSFKRGRLLDNFTLYKVPRNKGNRRTGNVRIFSKNPSTNESMKEMTIKNLKIDSIFLMLFTLSGRFIASSLMSVNLFNPYMPNVIKKVTIAIFKTKILYNKLEKIILKEPFIAKKNDVEIRNVMNLSDILLNSTDGVCITDLKKFPFIRIELTGNIFYCSAKLNPEVLLIRTIKIFIFHIFFALPR
jgi:hypothetical protein